jgi:tetratricopeptide (TPR) repeat protein
LGALAGGAAAARPTAAAERTSPAPAAQPEDQAKVEQASSLIGHAKPAEAVALLDLLIADQERRRSGETRQVYCARGPAEAAIYRRAAARARTPAVVLPESACYSVFLKGFALIDLDRSEEARLWLERTVAMAPSNAHFLGELGEWHKTRKDWPKARALFQRAIEASAVSPADRQVFDKTRGWRGLGYILVEDGRFDEAEAIYRQCLQLDPKDERAQHQLDYIARARQK